MKTRTRLLSLLLTVLMIAGMLPMSIFAIASSTKASYTDREDYVAANGGKYVYGTSFGKESKFTTGNNGTLASDFGGAANLSNVSVSDNGVKTEIDYTAGVLKVTSGTEAVKTQVLFNVADSNVANGESFVVEMSFKINAFPTDGGGATLYHLLTSNGDMPNTTLSKGKDNPLLYYKKCDDSSYGIVFGGSKGKDIAGGKTFALGEEVSIAVVIDPVIKRIHLYYDTNAADTVTEYTYLDTGVIFYDTAVNNWNGNFGEYNTDSKKYPQLDTFRIFQLNNLTGADYAMSSFYAYAGVDYPYGAVTMHENTFGSFLYDNGAKSVAYYDFEDKDFAQVLRDSRSNFATSSLLSDINYTLPYGNTGTLMMSYDGGYRMYVLDRNRVEGSSVVTDAKGNNSLQLSFNNAGKTSDSNDSQIYLYTNAQRPYKVDSKNVYNGALHSGIANHSIANGDTIVLSIDIKHSLAENKGYALFDRIATYEEGGKDNLSDAYKNLKISVDKNGNVSSNGTPIGKISTTEFTNVSAILERNKNKYSIAIDGKIVVEDQMLLASGDITKFNATGLFDGTLTSSDVSAWAPGYVRMFFINNTKDTESAGTVEIDNLAIYSGSKLSKTNFYRSVADGLIDGKYYKEGAVQTGLFEPYTTHDTHDSVAAGTRWFAESDGTVVVNATNKIVDISNGENVYADITNYVVAERSGFKEENDEAYYYVNGVIQKDQVINIEADGSKVYWAQADGKLFKEDAVKGTPTEAPNGNFYFFENYVGKLPHDEIINGKFWWNGTVITDEIIKDTASMDVSALGENEFYITNNNDGTLLAGNIFKMSDDVYYDVNASDATEKPYVAVTANGMRILGNDAYYFIDGVIQVNTVINIEEDGSEVYWAQADGKLFKEDAVTGTPTEAPNGKSYFFENYVGKIPHDNIINNQYWWNGNVVMEEVIKDGIQIGGAPIDVGALGANEFYLTNGTDGTLMTGENGIIKKSVNSNVWYAFNGYKAVKADGISNNIDGTTDYKFFADGVLLTGVIKADINVTFGTASSALVNALEVGQIYYADANGVLCRERMQIVNDLYYDFDSTSFVGTIRNGLVEDTVAGDTYTKYWVDGVAQTGDANGLIIVTDGTSTVYYLADKTTEQLKDGVQYVDDAIWDFNATTFEGTIRNGFIIDTNDIDINEAKGEYRYWIDGVAINGIYNVDDNRSTLDPENYTFISGNYEIYFVNGYPTAGTYYSDVDGRMRTYDQFGHRATGEQGEAMNPTHVIITLQVKGEAGKLGYRESYNLYGTQFIFKPNYPTCMKYTIVVTDANGVDKTADYVVNGVVSIAALTEKEITIVVTYDPADCNEDAHNWVLITEGENASVAPTCGTKGTNNYKCSYCVATKSEEVDELEHDWVVDDVNCAEPTCCEYGVYAEKCAHGCGATKTAPIEKLPHTWVEDTNRYVEPGCATTGKKYYTCSNTGCTAAERVVTVSATDRHNWDNGTVNAATCCEDGMIIYECSDCGAMKKHVIPATGLHEKDENDTDPFVLAESTSTTKGTVLYDCKHCGKPYCVAETTPEL